jgi:3-(3-hydroxy-phenyl)propionate hydroxylase
MNAEVEDLNATQRSLIVDIHPFESPAGLHPTRAFIRCNADRQVTYVPLQPPMLRFELMLEAADEAHVRERPDHVYWMLSSWLAPGSYRVMRTDTYEWHAHLVRGWRQGHLLLAGDAAHTMPPMLGQGMCSGLRDAANLAWKLAAVVSGRSDQSLLDTYESERAAHVRPFILESARQANMVENHGPACGAPTAEEPEQLERLRPRLGPGVVDIENVAAGYLAPQPQADDGVLFDDIVGYNFAVFTTPDIAGSVWDETWEMWTDLDARVVTTRSRGLDRWLADHGGDALIVRPDRYTFAVTRGADELHAASLSSHRLLEFGMRPERSRPPQ